jgi:hypothetical protein
MSAAAAPAQDLFSPVLGRRRGTGSRGSTLRPAPTPHILRIGITTFELLEPDDERCHSDTKAEVVMSSGGSVRESGEYGWWHGSVMPTPDGQALRMGSVSPLVPPSHVPALKAWLGGHEEAWRDW